MIQVYKDEMLTHHQHTKLTSEENIHPYCFPCSKENRIKLWVKMQTPYRKLNEHYHRCHQPSLKTTRKAKLRNMKFLNSVLTRQLSVIVIVLSHFGFLMKRCNTSSSILISLKLLLMWISFNHTFLECYNYAIGT